MLYQTEPLVHLITNDVTRELCVNALLSAGARAVCAESPEEVSEVTASSRALVLNLGMLTHEKEQAMLLSARCAAAGEIPVVLDPVGINGSAYRMDFAKKLFSLHAITCVRGNAHEIEALEKAYGVEDLPALSDTLGVILVQTGSTDSVAQGGRVFEITGGSPLAKRVTGFGCLTSALLGAALAEEPSGSSVIASLSKIKQAQEEAEDSMRKSVSFGTATFSACFLDAISRMGSPLFTRQCLRLYAVTDRRWLKEGQTLYQAVEQALSGGATMVQLREKDLSDEEMILEGKKLLPLCHRFQAPLVINDRVNVAKAVGADGVHLGLSDGSIAEARKILGPSAIIGATAHNAEEAKKAEAEGATYLGCGAAFGSATKGDAVPIAPGEYLRITSAVSIPVCAIGGIQKDNISALKGLGLSGVAVISGIFAQPDLSSAVSALLSSVRHF